MIRKLLFGLASTVLTVSSCLATSTDVEAYPKQAIRFIVPFSAGGGIDILGRVMAQELSERWKVPVIVENKAGASGNIGTQLAVDSVADGYTLLVTVNTLTMTPHLFSVRFDPRKDLKPVSHVAIGSLALVANPNFKANNFQDLVRLAKDNPGELNYSSPGVGTPHHLAMELLKQKANIDIQHIPYTGSAGALVDLMGGRVNFGFMPVHQVSQQVKAGQLKVLAAGGVQRTNTTPETPSLQEATGFEGVDVDMWYGVYAPAGTPDVIVAKINQAIGDILAKPAVRAHLSEQGLMAESSTSEYLGDVTSKDFLRWGALIKESAISVD